MKKIVSKVQSTPWMRINPNPLKYFDPNSDPIHSQKLIQDQIQIYENILI